jgi:hypothetical protein
MDFVLLHYEKYCLPKPRCHVVKTPKQLIYNYTTIKAWKYKQLINEMPCQKIRGLYCNCNLVSNGKPIHCNVCIVHTNVVNHV